MNILDFFNFSDTCPICQEPLTFFMQWVDSEYLGYPEKVFMGSKTSTGYRFNEHDLNSKQLGLYAQKIGDNKELFFLISNGEKPRVEFNCKDAQKLIRDTGLAYFYALCKPKALENDNGYYKINLYEGCYYRSTPTVTFTKGGKVTHIEYGPENRINRDENFCIQDRSEEMLKVYLCSMNYEDDNTTLWYYTATPTQEADEHYLPNVFEKQMPLLNSRPDLGLEGRDKLIDRFNTWVNFS